MHHWTAVNRRNSGKENSPPPVTIVLSLDSLEREGNEKKVTKHHLSDYTVKLLEWIVLSSLFSLVQIKLS